MRKALMIATALLTGALPVAADQRQAAPEMTAQLGALRNAHASNPYSKLFEARSALAQAVQQDAPKSGAPKQRIVCGMTIIEVGPELDPKMAIAPPKDQSVRYTIRAIEPPVCNASAAK